MAKYIDLSSVVDVEPEVCEVLPLIEDDDLQYEFWQRLDKGFFKDFLCNHCNENDLSTMKEILDEIIEDSKDAEELLKRTCGRIIHKTRYIIPATSGMLKWEVDEFHGEDEGLIIAEIELPSEDTQFDKPQWLGKEVTQDTTYYNSTLSKTSWKAIQKSYAEAKAWDDWRDSLVKG